MFTPIRGSGSLSNESPEVLFAFPFDGYRTTVFKLKSIREPILEVVGSGELSIFPRWTPCDYLVEIQRFKDPNWAS
jgi:hypothetical protein